MEATEFPRTVPGEPESARNRRLRRRDWRFLLDDPDPGVVIDLARATDAAPGVADLVVASNPSAAGIASAAARLRPGGSFYGEWRHRSLVSQDGILRRLEAAGLDRARIYWTWPPLWTNRVKVWIPTGSGEVLEHLRSERTPLHPPILRLGGRLSLLLWRVVARLGIHLYPLCVVARKPDPQDASVPNRESERRSGDTLPLPLAQRLRDGWEGWGFGPPPARMDWALQTVGPHSASKVVGLVFPAGSPHPRVVIKLARTAEAAAGLHREATSLRTLHNRAVGPLAGIPRVLYTGGWGGSAAIAETALVGAPLWRRIQNGTDEWLTRRVQEWSAQLAITTREAGTRESLSGRPEPVALVEEFARLYRPAVSGPLIEHSRAALGDLDHLPKILEHRDYAPWNILTGPSGELGVLDWESSSPQGFPGLDLIYYLTYHHGFATGALGSGRMPEAYRAARAERAPRRLADGCLEAYLRALRIHASVVPALRLLTWIVHAISSHPRLSTDAGGTAATPTQLHANLFLQLWREEAAEQVDATRRTLR